MPVAIFVSGGGGKFKFIAKPGADGEDPRGTEAAGNTSGMTGV